MGNLQPPAHLYSTMHVSVHDVRLVYLFLLGKYQVTLEQSHVQPYIVRAGCSRSQSCHTLLCSAFMQALLKYNSDCLE